MTASHGRQRQPLTPWELPSLLTSVHTFRRSKRKGKKERPHFSAILGFVYRNRFAVASQIQRRFCDIMRSDRTARRHLEELEALGHLAVVPAQGVSPLFPKVYYVTGRGVQRLQESLAAHGRPWQAVRVDRRGRQTQDGYAVNHIVHELLVTQFMLAVWQTVEGREDLELLTIQRRSLSGHPAFRLVREGHRNRLVPDAMFLFRHAAGGMACCFVEMDNGTMNKKKIRVKYSGYAAWAHSVAGQQYLMDLYRRHGAAEPRPTFRLLVVARGRTGQDDHRRMLKFFRPITKLPASMQDRLWFTTVAALRNCQEDSLPLDAAIWHRGRDAGHLETVAPAGSGGRIQLQEHVAGPLNPASNRLYPLFPSAGPAGI